ncbi:MAG: hypothetical protein NTU44_06390 [Bacteroidetes bacterium]|nr:hypothetical protein [Bacteroidota bacterium]
MLTIRKSQIEVLDGYMRRSFFEKAIQHLRRKYPDKTNDKTEEELIEFVSVGIDKADSYDINERIDVLPFLEYIICYGNDFEKDPENKWATKVFRIINLSGEEKMARLMKNHPLKPDTL